MDGWQAVELHEVQGLHAQVLAAAIRPRPERLGRVARHVQGRAPAHLGGDEECLAGALGQEAADHPLAPPVAVDVGGVDEVHASVGSRVQGSQAVGVVHRAPVRPDRPCPEADDADVASGLAEPAVLHAVGLLWRGAGFQPIPGGAGARRLPDRGHPDRLPGRRGSTERQGFSGPQALRRPETRCSNLPQSRRRSQPRRPEPGWCARTRSQVSHPARSRLGLRDPSNPVRGHARNGPCPRICAPRGTRPGRRRGRRRVTGGGIPLDPGSGGRIWLSRWNRPSRRMGA